MHISSDMKYCEINIPQLVIIKAGLEYNTSVNLLAYIPSLALYVCWVVNRHLVKSANMRKTQKLLIHVQTYFHITEIYPAPFSYLHSL